MYIRQYQEIAASLKTLTQRVLTPQHSIMGRYEGDPVQITFSTPITYQFPQGYRPLDVTRLEDGLENAGLYKNGRVLYRVGGIYTVMHKRGKPSVHHAPVAFPGHPKHSIIVAPQTKAEASEIEALGWLPLKIEITRIRFGTVQAMTDADVIAEGVSDREAYSALWNAINGAQAWPHNPVVARIHFKLFGVGDLVSATTPVTAPETMTGKEHPERRLT